LKYTDLIIDNSPAILFRRLASADLKKRRMVYVSPNISRFGYTAEDFLNNKIMFREIVHPEDTDRIAIEIQEYVRKNIENYTQTYRIITRDDDVRWVEDHTSVIDNPDTGIRYHQGIVTDIHRRKMAEEKLRKSEGHNKAGEMFGKDRFQEIIRWNSALTAETILDSIFREHRIFTQDTQTEDDLTLVIIKIKRID
jgi:sigma-B regulation protein RsbU (phosphoserine phosphatase)